MNDRTSPDPGAGTGYPSGPVGDHQGPSQHPAHPAIDYTQPIPVIPADGEYPTGWYPAVSAPTELPRPAEHRLPPPVPPTRPEPPAVPVEPVESAGAMAAAADAEPERPRRRGRHAMNPDSGEGYPTGTYPVVPGPEATGSYPVVPDPAATGQLPVVDPAEPVERTEPPAEPTPVPEVPSAATAAPAVEPEQLSERLPDPPVAGRGTGGDPLPAEEDGWLSAAPTEATVDLSDLPDVREPGPDGSLPTCTYQLRINGAEYPVENAWLGESLLYVLRERLDLFGSKNACECGQCGSCSVLVDGVLVNACLVLAVTAQGRAITTIEGLTPEDEDEPLSDVQRAFVDVGAVQCGFCTPGMVVAVHDLLRRNPSPGEFEIREALAGNLCRCTGYGRIFEAVHVLIRERAEAEQNDTGATGTHPVVDPAAGQALGQ